MKTEKTKAIGKVIIVFVVSIVIWRLTLLIFDSQKFAGSVLWHIAAGLFLSMLICVLIITMLRMERRENDFSSWVRAIPGNLKDISFGFLCWIIPAAISICVFTAVGQTAIIPQTTSSALIMNFFTLLIAVFFMEAFPEEIVRGYLYSRLEASFSPWVALLAQTILFTSFAFFVGSLYSTDQLLFIPGFGFLLGYFRMISGAIWFSMGFHAAMMTITQLIIPMRQLLEVDGSFFAVRFLSFILVPAIVSSIILHLRKKRTEA